MNSREALKKLYFDNEDLDVDITLNDRKVCEIYNTIKQDLDKLNEIKSVLSLLKLRLNITNVAMEDDFYFIDTKYGTRYAINKQEFELLGRYFGNEN